MGDGNPGLLAIFPKLCWGLIVCVCGRGRDVSTSNASGMYPVTKEGARVRQGRHTSPPRGISLHVIAVLLNSLSYNSFINKANFPFGLTPRLQERLSFYFLIILAGRGFSYHLRGFGQLFNFFVWSFSLACLAHIKYKSK